MSKSFTGAGLVSALALVAGAIGEELRVQQMESVSYRNSNGNMGTQTYAIITGVIRFFSFGCWGEGVEALAACTATVPVELGDTPGDGLKGGSGCGGSEDADCCGGCC